MLLSMHSGWQAFGLEEINLLTMFIRHLRNSKFIGWSDESLISPVAGPQPLDLPLDVTSATFFRNLGTEKHHS
jgi:hypothetical protein